MSAMRLPSGIYHQTYSQDHAWWQTNFVKLRMFVLGVLLFFVFPMVAGGYWLSFANRIGYTILGALGVQLLIGFAKFTTLISGGKDLKQISVKAVIEHVFLPKINFSWRIGIFTCSFRVTLLQISRQLLHLLS